MRPLTLLLSVSTVLILGCSKAQHVPPETKNVPGDFRFYEERLVNDFVPGGFVVSKAGGEERDQGDSLLFTGVALAAIDCDLAPTILDGLEAMQSVWGGYLVRFHPIPQEYIEKHNVITRDGATGALYGLVKVAKRCPDLAIRANAILTRWRDAVGDAFFLHPEGRKGLITPSFKAFWKVAFGEKISDLEYGLFIGSALVTAASIKNARSACYPVHLQTLQNLTLESQGRPLLAADKAAWCDLTADMGLYLTDWYCQRDGDKLLQWLKNPEESQHIYVHQRCSWEQSDGDGVASPRVDFLTLFENVKNGSMSWLESSVL